MEEKIKIKKDDIYEVPSNLGGIFTCKVYDVYDGFVFLKALNNGFENVCFHKPLCQVKEYKKVYN